MEQVLNAEETLKTKKTDLLMIDPRNIIVEEGFNVRTDMGDIDGLSESIVEVGQLEPITVCKQRGTDKYILTDGHRRMAAINRAIEQGKNIPYVRAIVSTGNIEDRLFAMVITGIGKKALNSLEEGEAYKRLKAYGYEVKDIAAKVGKSLPHIYNMLKLADVPQQVKKYVTDGSISGNTVVGLLKDAKTAEDLLRIVEEAVLASEVEQEVEVADGKTQTGGKKKKATARHTGVLSPMKKLEEAMDIAIEKGYEVQLLHDLLTKLQNKNSKPADIAKLFK
jgi:ParB family transcriptional regulator, chromosome partitioning protein